MMNMNKMTQNGAFASPIKLQLKEMEEVPGKMNNNHTDQRSTVTADYHLPWCICTAKLFWWQLHDFFKENIVWKSGDVHGHWCSFRFNFLRKATSLSHTHAVAPCCSGPFSLWLATTQPKVQSQQQLPSLLFFHKHDLAGNWRTNAKDICLEHTRG